MAFCTLGGAPATSARLCLPRRGAWHALLEVDAGQVQEGRAGLQLGGLGFAGTVRRSGADGGLVSVRLVAGGGGMDKTVGAQGFHETTFRTALEQILDAAGERLSAKSEQAILDRQLKHWATRACPAGQAVAALLVDTGAVWRMFPNGEVWVGTETWPASSASYEVVAYDGSSDKAELFMQSPTLLPGTALGGRRVSRVEHQVEASRIRTMAWFER